MSKCLTGEYEHRLDTKGRLIMPSKLREELGCTFMITKGLDNCLYVYPNDEWQQFARSEDTRLNSSHRGESRMPSSA